VHRLRVEGCGRCHVFGLRVQRRPDRAVARIVPCSPGAGEDLVGPPAEQERVGALVDLVHDRPRFVVEVGPSAALEYAALVLMRPAGPLHHSVNGDLRGGRQFHGSFFFLSWWSFSSMWHSGGRAYVDLVRTKCVALTVVTCSLHW